VSAEIERRAATSSLFVAVKTHHRYAWLNWFYMVQCVRGNISPFWTEKTVFQLLKTLLNHWQTANLMRSTLLRLGTDRQFLQIILTDKTNSVVLTQS